MNQGYGIGIWDEAESDFRLTRKRTDSNFLKYSSWRSPPFLVVQRDAIQAFNNGSIYKDLTWRGIFVQWMAFSGANWFLFVPHWLILLAVAALWLLLLFVRARRRNKITQ